MNKVEILCLMELDGIDNLVHLNGDKMDKQELTTIIEALEASIHAVCGEAQAREIESMALGRISGLWDKKGA